MYSERKVSEFWQKLWQDCDCILARPERRLFGSYESDETFYSGEGTRNSQAAPTSRLTPHYSRSGSTAASPAVAHL